eukprot:SAG25_NODE_1079_length_4095_cov_1.941191_1_plen_87_part_00
MLFTRHDDDHVIGELWDTLLCVLLERLEDVHLATRERAARFVTPPHPTRVRGCHKPVSLGVIFVGALDPRCTSHSTLSALRSQRSA